MCQEIVEILPPLHPCEIKEAQGIVHWHYCLPLTEAGNNCQTVEADEGHLWEGVNPMQHIPERFCQMKADPTILPRTLALSGESIQFSFI